MPLPLSRLTSGGVPEESLRQRTRDQLELIAESRPDLLIASETDDPADFAFICERDHVLLAPEDPDPDLDAANRLQRYFLDRQDVFDDVGGLADGPVRARRSRRYALPGRRSPGDQDLLRTLAELDRDPAFGPDFARPNHYLHVAGKCTCCPATEPTETGLTEPWPPINTTADAGADVNVVVIDTGWYPPAAQRSWLQNVDGDLEPQPIPVPPGQLQEYAGHGTFVAGVVRAVAPACNLHVLSFHVDAQFPGGGVLEEELVQRLDDALDRDPVPHLINLSAGCPTRLDRPLRAFEDWWLEVQVTHPDLVLVAAAGNNSSPGHFYPASFPWAVGVGSLDRDGIVSSFSNYGASADVFALGRNLVNAFPLGDYTCRESPEAGDERTFGQMLARWSGTSFAAPLVTGLVAAEMSAHQLAAPAAVAAVRASGQQVVGATTVASILPSPFPPYPV